jgi:hypothetical protein
MRVGTTIEAAIDGFLRWQPRGAPLEAIYAAVERQVESAKRPSIRRALHDGTKVGAYVRVARGRYALAEAFESRPRK